MLGIVKSRPTRVLLFIGLIAASSFCSRAASPANAAARKSEVAQNYGKLPLSFEANHGQTDSQVRFVSRGSGYALFLTDSAAVLSLTQHNSTGSAKSQSAPSRAAAPELVRMELAGANPKVRITGADQLPGVSNYFLGNDPARWRTNIPTYAKVRYSGIYPGIDLVYYGNQRQLEYDFIVAPDANPGTIKLHFAGAQKLSLTPAGDLRIQSRSSEIAFRKPVIYQQAGEKRTEIPGQFKLLASNTVSFQIGNYNRTQPLVIDPVLSYSTYLGGTTSDAAYGIAVDAEGSAYVAGTTYSSDFPTTSGALQPKDQSLPAIFITKFNPAGSALVYSTYLSGESSVGGGDRGVAIAVDSSGNAYVTGIVYSPDFPVTSKAFQTTPPMKANPSRSSAFVTKLNAAGNSLVYSTYLGGSVGNTSSGLGDAGTGIAVDSAGNAYIAGITNSTNFPVTSGAFQTILGNGFCSNAFVTKLNPTGASLVYSTYLGGGTEQCTEESDHGTYFTNLGDWANTIAVDAAGDAYVAGNATSTDFPVTAGAFQTANKASGLGRGNAFITKLNPSGSEQVYSTFLGGDNAYEYLDCSGDTTDGIRAIAVDASGDAYVTGSTLAPDFPTTTGSLNKTGAPPTPGLCLGYAFVTKLNPAGSQLDFSTFLGGETMAPLAIAVDSAGNSYLTGSIYNDSGRGYFDATPGALSATGPIFVDKLDPSGKAMEYATAMGAYDDDTGAIDEVQAIALDASGNVYITGQANTTVFPTTGGAFQDTNKAPKGNAFVSKLALAGETGSYVSSYISITGAPATARLGQSATLTAKVTGTPGVAAPTGIVSFFGFSYSYNDYSSVTPVQATLNSSGVATGTIPNLQEGNYTFYANYLGDANHLTSSSYSPIPPQTLVIGPPANLTASQPIGIYGQTAGFLAQVTDKVGYELAGVTVNFSAPKGYTLLTNSAVTNSIGYATVKAVATQVGSFDVTASVSGTSLTATQVAQNGPAPLSILVLGQPRFYGLPNSAFKSVITGLVGSDTVTVNYQTSATTASPVGVYPITATISGPDASNYTPTITDNTVRVNPAPISISARNVATIYGQAPPQLTGYILTGFVNGDTASVVSGAPVLSTIVTTTTPVGTYPITVGVGTLTAANYFFKTTSSGEGSVTVYKAPLNILPNSITIHAGDPMPAFTYTLSGFVNGDTQASATTGAPVLTTAATSTNTPGRYYIYATAGTLAARNYAFVPPNQSTYGILTILPN